jgi:hypothetical protein
MKRRALEVLLEVDQAVQKRPDPRRDAMTTVCTVIGPSPPLGRATVCGEAMTLACSRKPIADAPGTRRAPTQVSLGPGGRSWCE